MRVTAPSGKRSAATSSQDRPAGAAPALRLSGATIGYGPRPVVMAADLEVWPGEAVALVGANGAGKTTVVRALVGQADVLSGDLRVAGRPVAHRRRGRAIGYVPQRLTPPAGVPTTAAEVVATGLLAGGRWRPRRGGRASVSAALDQVGLGAFARTPVTELSGGQHRRVLIARALVAEPHLLLLDEPTAGVDRASVDALVQTLAELRDDGRTLLIATHELTELSGVVRRVVSLADGRLVEDDVVADPVGGH